MTITEALADVRRIFLDTAPLIYAIEQNPTYIHVVSPVFPAIDRGDITAVTSPVTLAETLVIPYRLQSLALQRQYDDQIVSGLNTVFVAIDDAIAHQAAEFRARYNLTLPDAFQVAVAIRSHCDTLLTNDTILRRVTELRVIVIGDMEP